MAALVLSLPIQNQLHTLCQDSLTKRDIITKQTFWVDLWPTALRGIRRESDRRAQCTVGPVWIHTYYRKLQQRQQSICGWEKKIRSFFLKHLENKIIHTNAARDSLFWNEMHFRLKLWQLWFEQTVFTQIGSELPPNSRNYAHGKKKCRKR